VKGALLCSIRPILVIRVLNPLDFLPSPGQRESIDKVAHFAEYAGLLLRQSEKVTHHEDAQTALSPL